MLADLSFFLTFFFFSGSFVTAFGTFGNTLGGLNAPTGVAFDRQWANIYVVDSGNSRVQLYSSTGVFVKTISKNLDLPFGIDVAKVGGSFLQVTDLNDDLTIFSAAGLFLESVNSFGSSCEFSKPTAVNVDPFTGLTFMAGSFIIRLLFFYMLLDTLNHRVRVVDASLRVDDENDFISFVTALGINAALALAIGIGFEIFRKRFKVFYEPKAGLE